MPRLYIDGVLLLLLACNDHYRFNVGDPDKLLILQMLHGRGRRHPASVTLANLLKDSQPAQ
jgi:hypothetical protein